MGGRTARGSEFGGAVDGAPDAWISSAAANVAGHGLVNILVSGLGIFANQDGGAHDLAGLAVATLRDVNFDPGALQRMRAVRRKAFNGGDMLAGDARNWRNTGADGLSIEMHRTGPAERHAAAELGAGHAQRIAQHPQQRCGRLIIHRNRFSIQGEGSHAQGPPQKKSNQAESNYPEQGPTVYWNKIRDKKVHGKSGISVLAGAWLWGNNYFLKRFSKAWRASSGREGVAS